MLNTAVVLVYSAILSALTPRSAASFFQSVTERLASTYEHLNNLNHK